MEKHECKLCLRTFGNGRALGGHMRSHMLNLHVPPNVEQEKEGKETENLASFSSPSDSFSSSSEEESEEKVSLLGYGLRENPKKSLRLVDPEFSFAGGSVVLQDRESETESSKNPIRRRSKRIQKSGLPEQESTQAKKVKSCKTESCWAEQEPVSSISDTSPQEDVAYCLMMLSRDKWKTDINIIEDECKEIEVGVEAKNYEFDQLDQSEDCNVAKVVTKKGVRGKYRCETCARVFRSYQALGGHRASHKRMKQLAATSTNSFPTQELSMVEAADNSNANANASSLAVAAEEKIHECPVCSRVFASGQALGGHKRSHVTRSAAINPITISPTKPPQTPPPTPPPAAAKFGRETLIDLNLPAPIDDDVELSAVSDAEFLNSIRQ